MTILLDILKVAGILLLIIVLVLLLGILAILFVPVRYKVKSAYDKVFFLDIRFSWLFHILGGRVYYQDETQNMILTVLGIPVWDKLRSEQKRKKRKKSADREEKKTVTREKKVHQEQKNTKEIADTDRNTQSRIVIPETSSENKETETGEKNKFVLLWQTIKAIVKRLAGYLQNIKYTFERICDKIKKSIDNINYYKELLHNQRIQRTIQIIKRWGIKFMHNIRPKTFRTSITFGMDDPAVVADILSVYSVLYPWIGQNISVSPYFESVPFELNLFMKGRVTMYWIFYAIWKYLFDKDIRYLKHRIIREES